MKRKFNYVVPAVLVAVTTFLIYLPALRNGFVGVWDDNAYIVGNFHIRSLDAAFFRWAFLDFHVSNWHPLTWVLHALDYAMWGLNPVGHHLTSIVLHAVNTFLVVLLVMRLTNHPYPSLTKEGNFIPNSSPPILGEVSEGRGGKRSHDSRFALIAASVTGLLFGLHPVHVESVAWVSETKDLLCALFFLLSIIMYVKYVTNAEKNLSSTPLPVISAESILESSRRMETQCFYGTLDTPVEPEYDRNKSVIPRLDRRIPFLNKHYSLTLGFFILALLSKPMAVSLPLILLILDWYPFGRLRHVGDFLTVGAEKIPFLALSLFSSGVTILAQSSGESVASLQLTPLSIRLPVAAESLIAYLEKMMLPLDLVPFYPYPQAGSLISLRYLFAIALVLGITLACFFLRKKQKFWSAVWGSYVVMLIPVLGIVKVGNQAMADRYTYLPSLGPFIIAGLFMAWIAGKAKVFQRKGTLVMLASVAVALLIFAALSYGTFLQIGIWRDGFVLWDYAIAKGFGSATAFNNRGLSFDDRGERDKAKEDFETAIARDPWNYSAYNNLGVFYGKGKQYQKSIEYFLKAITINPRHADSYCNLGLSYFYLNQYGRSLENYSMAIKLKEDFDMAYLNRGNLYLIIGEKEHALTDYRKSCALGNRNACDAFRLATGT